MVKINSYSKKRSLISSCLGPPQLSAFARSSSGSSAVEQEPKKPTDESVQPTEESPSKKDDDDDDEDGESTPGVNLAGFLQLLQGISGSSVRVEPSAGGSTDDDDGIQNLLTRLGIVPRKFSSSSSSVDRSLNYSGDESRKKVTNVPPRQVGNVENFLLVYLDSSAPNESLLIKFRGLVNYFKTFDDPDDCIAFINSISNEKVILFVSDALGDPVVSRIQDLQQLFAIYVLCPTEDQAEQWSANQPKIRGISTDITELLDKIQQDIEHDENNLLTFTYSLPNADGKKDPLFVINQIIKDILLDPEEMTDAKKELVEFARMEYENNEEQLQFIQEFEENYRKDHPMEFFEKHRFLYKVNLHWFSSIDLVLFSR